MGFLNSSKKEKLEEKRKKSTVYSSAKIKEILDNRTSGYEPDMTPFYENDYDFRAPNLLFQLTPEEEEEWLKCSTDCLYFITHYCKFQTDHGRTLVKLRDYQKRFIHLLGDEVWSYDVGEFVPKERYLIGLMSRQLGKCFDLQTISVKTSKKSKILEMNKEKFSFKNYFKKKWGHQIEKIKKFFQKKNC